MISQKIYIVTKQIKLHTKPLRTEQIAKTGKFEYETDSYYIFDTFRVRKANVIKIQDFTGGG